MTAKAAFNFVSQSFKVAAIKQNFCELLSIHHSGAISTPVPKIEPPFPIKDTLHADHITTTENTFNCSCK
jgi:hypothetical protein